MFINEDLLNKMQKVLEEENHTLLLSGMDIINLKWDSKVPIKCNKCGTEKSINVNYLIRPNPPRVGMLCQFCNSERLFEQRLITEYGRVPYEFLSPFKGYMEPIAVKCKDCGKVWVSKIAKNLIVHVTDHHPCNGCRAIRREQKKAEKGRH